MITSRALHSMLLIAALGIWSAEQAPAFPEGGDSAALAAAMRDATATLQGGLKASEREGTPISAKFEIEDGKLQLSVYTMKGEDFMEVVADPKTGTSQRREDHRCRRSQGRGSAESSDGKGEGALTDRGDFGARDYIQEGDGEAGLTAAGWDCRPHI
jgi:hypothetical protein